MASFEDALSEGMGVSEAIGDATPAAALPVFKGYIALAADTSIQTITTMTLATAGTSGAGGTLSNGDYCLLISAYSYYQAAALVPGLGVNGTLATLTSIGTITATDFFNAHVSAYKLQIGATPTSLTYGINSSGTLVAPATGTNSGYEELTGYLLVFDREPLLNGSVVSQTAPNGANLPAMTVTGETGSLSFFVAGGYGPSGGWAGGSNGSNEMTQKYTRTATYPAVLVGWNSQATLTSDTLTGGTANTLSSASMTFKITGTSSGGGVVTDVGSDALATSETIVTNMGYAHTSNETLGLAPSISPEMILAELLAETILALDTASFGDIAVEIVGDTTTFGESFVETSYSNVVAEDVLTLIEAAVGEVYKTVIASDTFRIPDLISETLARSLALSDSFSLLDSTVTVQGIWVLDRVGVTSSATVTAIYAALISEIGRISELVELGIPMTAADEIVLSYSVAALRAVEVIEQLGLADVILPAIVAAQTVTEQVRLLDVLTRFFGAEAGDGIGMADGVQQTFVLPQTLTELLGLADAPAGALVLRVTTVDGVGIDDSWQLSALFSGVLSEDVSISAMYVAPDGTFTTWAVNTRSGAVTEYTNYTFNSFARMGARYLGASATGLYELDGDDDAGTDIIADLKGGFIQFNGSRFAGMKAVYLGVRGGGEFFLKLEAASGETYTYKVIAEDMETTKVWIGKGLRHRYLSYELISTGQDFDLESIEFVPMLAQRRV